MTRISRRPARPLIVLVIAVFTVTSLPAGISSDDGRAAETSWDPPNYPGYTPHGDIIIKNDTQLVNMASSDGWSGNGSRDNPYIVQGYNFTRGSEYYSIVIRDVSYFVTIRDCLLHDVGGGIYIYNVTGGSIENVTIDGLIHSGILVTSVNGNWTIRDNHISNYTSLSRSSGILVWYSEGVTVDNNTVKDISRGIRVGNSQNTTVTNNTLVDNWCWGADWRYDYHANSIRDEDSHNSTYDGNDITSDFVFSTFHILRSDNVTIRNTTFNGTGFSIGTMKDQFLKTLSIDANCTINGTDILFLKDRSGKDHTTKFGQLIVINCTNTTVRDVTGPSQFAGGYVLISKGVRVDNCTFDSEINFSISVSSDWNAISNCTLVNGNITNRASNCSYTGNMIDGKEVALDVKGEDVNITGNVFGPNVETGLFLGHVGRALGRHELTARPTIVNNTFKTTIDAVYFSYGTQSVTMVNNNMTGGGIDVHWDTSGLEHPRHYSGHVIPTSNMLNGHPVLYLDNVTWMNITGSYGMVFISHSSNIRVSDMSFDGGSAAVLVAHSKDITITRNSISNVSGNAIDVRETWYVDIVSNRVDGGYRCLSTEESRYFDIINNTLHNATRYGMLVSDTWHATVRNNNVTNSSWIGVEITDCQDVEFVYNNIEGCTWSGLVYGSYKCKVHHNNLIENMKDPATGKSLGTQCDFWRNFYVQWDNGTEGNYYSNYRYRYPSATKNGTVWDTPYDLSPYNDLNDTYPLVDPVDYRPPSINQAFPDLTVDQGTTVVVNSTRAKDESGTVYYEWSFLENGTWVNQTTSSFNHTFDLPGVYRVTLRVEDAHTNYDEVSFTVTVLDTESPVADAGKDQTVDQGTTVLFNATGSRDNVGIVNHTWRFQYNGTDHTLLGVSPNHTFLLPGIYVVTLNVTDAAGNWAEDGLNVTVLDTENPVARVATGFIEVDQGDWVDLNASLSTDNVGIVNHTWTFGYNGTVLNLFGVHVPFRFDIPRNYSIQLTVRDAAGNSDHTLFNVLVHDTEAPVADAGDDVSIDQRSFADFDAGGSSDNVDIIDYTWNLTYGANPVVLHGRTASFRFNDAGSYNVTLTVQDAEGNRARDWLTVTVNDIDPPVAVAGEDVEVDQRTYVDLNGSASTDNVGITGYTWTFTEGGLPWTLNGPEVTFQFNNAGAYTVTLEVSDAAGNVANDTLVVTVLDIVEPVPRAITHHDVPTNTTVEFNATGSSDNVGIVSCLWAFRYDGRNVTLEGVVATFLFHVPGEYNVTLAVADEAGNQGSLTVVVRVTDEEPPVIVTETLLKAAIGDTVRFDASRSHDNVGISAYNWSFEYDGDNVTLTGPSPEFTFDVGGIYDVLLYVSDTSGNGVSASITLSVRDANAPVADAGENATIDQSSFHTLDGSGSTDVGGIVSWTWTFELDGVTVTLEGEEPVFSVAEPGVYRITLVVEDADGLTDADIVFITVLDTEPPMAYAGDDIVVPEGEELTLDGGMSLDNVGIVSWTWTIRQGVDVVVGVESGSTVTMTLPPGVYNVTLRVEDAANNSDSDHLTVRVRGDDAPVADAGPDATVEGGREHTFDGGGTTSVHGITSYEWVFECDGEDITLEGERPSFLFMVPGVYVVDLTVVDAKGYPDVDSVTITVVDTTLPEAHIVVTKGEEGERPILDGGKSTDLVGITNWTWEVAFGNEMTHLYGSTVELHRDDPGRYEVTLTVRDAAGNEDHASTCFKIEGDDTFFDATWLFISVAVIAALAVVAFVGIRMMRGNGRRED